MSRGGACALAALLVGGAAGAPAAQVLADTAAAPPPAVQTAPRPADAWLGRDKALHAGASFLLTLSGQYVLVSKAGLSDGDALPLSAGAALGLGLLKEAADAGRATSPLFSWRDLAADAVGVLLAVLLVEL